MALDEETAKFLMDYIRSQTQILTSISIENDQIEKFAEKAADNIEKMTMKMAEESIENKSFRKTIFRVLIGIIIFLMFVVIGLMTELGIKGTQSMSNAIEKVLP